MGVENMADRTPVWDARRARELFRYLRPSDLVPGGIIGNHDDAPHISAGLAPFCQLLAMRCKAPRVLLSVMDRDIMYFLSDASMQENGGEMILAEDAVTRACSGAVPLEGRVCEITIRMTTKADTAPPIFVVNDLTKSRFKHLDVVTGPPYFRFYAGTPLTTKYGVTIGSLAFLDTRPRDGVTQVEEQSLTRIAAQAVMHLETNRQAIEGRRSLRLARSLECFVAGQKSMINERPRDFVKRTSTYGFTSQPSDKPEIQPLHRIASLASDDTSDNEYMTDEIDTTAKIEGENAELEAKPTSRSLIFARAANLLREGFGGLGKDGSVVFASLKNSLVEVHSNASSQVKVFASSTDSRPFSFDSDQVLLEDEMLRSLVQHYPEGQIFVLDEPVNSSDEEVEVRSVGKHSQKTSRKAYELQILRRAFPHASQILFAPLWDSDAAAYLHAVFVTNASEDYSLSPVNEIPFLKSFCSSALSECSRVEAMEAEKQKSDFVGTISHEMRSPLHGMLACAEFMTDTDLTTYQRSLTETVQSCGRTLLETINHVLDFSKINTSRKNWQAENSRTNALGTNRQYLGADKNGSTPAAPTLLQLTSVVNIADVVEEVVDSLILEQNFKTNIDITEQNRQARQRGPDGRFTLPMEDVRVDLDIQKANWDFKTQPGAIRRVVLNLAGNALKYTTKGSITVQLELGQNRETNENAMVLTVTDTGQGIGSKFLNSMIYVPFAQENPLAPGTGLGLSIVHSIVTMLGGSIDIKSQLQRGTTVKVVVPLQSHLQDKVSENALLENGSPIASRATLSNDPIVQPKNQSDGLRALIYGSDVSKDHFKSTMEKYLIEWQGFQIVDQVHEADVIITQQDNIYELKEVLQTAGVRNRVPVVLVTCNLEARNNHSFTSDIESSFQGVVEWVLTPIGPKKLAKSIKSGLERRIPFESQPFDKKNSETYLNQPQQNNISSVPRQREQISFDTQVHKAAVRDMNRTGEKEPLQEDAADSVPSQPLETANVRKVVGRAISSPNPIGAIQKPSLKKRSTEKTLGDASRADIDPFILVVDDNRINSSVLKTFLAKKRKYTRVECAENGKEALDLFKRSHGSHEIIFMDISMPLMNGFQATRAIRKWEQQRSRGDFDQKEQEEVVAAVTAAAANDGDGRGKGSMVVALTGLASEKDQAEGMESGMDIYLTKPVSLKAVGDLLDDWELHQMRTRQAQQQSQEA